MQLSALSAAPSTTITLRGQSVTVRAISMREMYEMRLQCPPPSAVGRTPEEEAFLRNAPDYRQRMTDYLQAQMALQAGAAAGIIASVGGWRGDMSAADARAYADEIARVLTQEEVGAIDRAREELTRVDLRRAGTGDEPGN